MDIICGIKPFVVADRKTEQRTIKHTSFVLAVHVVLLTDHNDKPILHSPLEWLNHRISRDLLKARPHLLWMMNGRGSLIITKLGYYKLPYRLTQAERNIAAPLATQAARKVKERNTTKEDFLFDCGWATIFHQSVVEFFYSSLETNHISEFQQQFISISTDWRTDDKKWGVVSGWR